MEKTLSIEQREAIQKKMEALKKENPKVKKIMPIVVFGEDGDEKELYVVYFRKPNFMEYSKWMSLMKKDETKALKSLATDCFLAGDKELIDDDDLFLFGTAGQLNNLMESRQSELVNF